MQGVERVEIKGHRPMEEKVAAISGPQFRFYYTRDYKLGFAICAQLKQCQGFFDLIATETFRSCGNGSGLFLQAACECRQG